ncbi:MAG: hypothetical protein EBR82_24750 [Caulobacteraceae bacterium]|nr:hypothetical protein [Caulobacteraceae bacterium]
MGMIKFRSPALPLPWKDYNPDQQNQLIRALNIYFSQLDSTTPLQAEYFRGRGDQLVQPYAMLISSVDQASAGITSENLIEYDPPSITNGITVVNNTKIYVPYAGQYLVTFSLQVTNRGNSAGEFEVWAKRGNINIESSNTRFDIAARKSSTIWSHIVPTITLIFDVTDPNTEYFQLAWWSDKTTVYLENYAAGTSPSRPAIPSVIFTINLISANP